MSEEDLAALNNLVTKLLTDSAHPVELPQDRAQRMKARVMARVRAASPEGSTTLRAREGTWEPFDDGITRRLLMADPDQGVELALYRLEPGAAFAPHEHTHDEECWVVQGDIMIGDLLVEAGDMHIARAGSAHPALTARSSSLLLIRSQVYVGPLTPPG